MCKPLRLAAVAAGLLLVRVTAAQALIVGATFDPPFPTTQDLVHITVTGQLPLCALSLDAAVTDPANSLSTGVISLRAQACPVDPTPPLVPWAESVTVGPLPAGFYTVETEDHLFTAPLTVAQFQPLPIHSLFLVRERFEATVAWHTATASGVGQPEALSDNSGSFWFFDPTNPELMVKVIDGSPVNGHFWVFVGGLTDVAYTLTIADRFTNAVRTYTNSRGTVTSQADTSAFLARIDPPVH